MVNQTVWCWTPELLASIQARRRDAGAGIDDNDGGGLAAWAIGLIVAGALYKFFLIASHTCRPSLCTWLPRPVDLYRASTHLQDVFSFVWFVPESLAAPLPATAACAAAITRLQTLWPGSPPTSPTWARSPTGPATEGAVRSRPKTRAGVALAPAHSSAQGGWTRTAQHPIRTSAHHPQALYSTLACLLPGAPGACGFQLRHCAQPQHAHQGHLPYHGLVARLVHKRARDHNKQAGKSGRKAYSRLLAS